MGDSLASDNIAPDGSPGGIALEKFKAFYPAGYTLTGFILYFQNKDASIDAIKEAIVEDLRAQIALNATWAVNGLPADYSYIPSPNARLLSFYADTITDNRYNSLDFNLDYYCRHEGREYLKADLLATYPVFATLQMITLLTHYMMGVEKNVFDISHPHTFFNSFSSYRSVELAQLPNPVATQYTAQTAITVSGFFEGNTSLTLDIVLNTSAYAIVSVKPYATDGKVKDFAKALERDVPEMLKLHGLDRFLTASVISAPNFYDLIGTSLGDDINRVFWIILPITIIFFGVTIGSGRLAILPVPVFIISLLASMAMIYGVAWNKSLSVNSLASGVAVVYTMGLTMEYCFLILSQWKRAANDQIRDMLQDAVKNKGKKLFGDGATTFQQILCERRLQLGPQDSLGVPIFSPEDIASGNLANNKIPADGEAAFKGFSKEYHASLVDGTAEMYVANEFNRVELMKRVWSTAGRTIFTTTLVVLCGTIAMYSFKLDQIASLGVSIFTTTLITFLVTIIIVPNALLLWHVFFFYGAAERYFDVVTPESVTTPANQRSRKEDAVKDTEKLVSNKTAAKESESEKKKKLQSNKGSGVSRKHGGAVDNVNNSGEPSEKSITEEGKGANEPIEDSEEGQQPQQANHCDEVEENSMSSSEDDNCVTKEEHYKINVGRLLSHYDEPIKYRREDVKTRQEQAHINDTAHLDTFLFHAQTTRKVRGKLQSWYQTIHTGYLVKYLPLNLIAVCTGLILPVAFLAYGWSEGAVKYSSNLKQYMPMNAKVVEGWDGFMREYLPGHLFAYNFINVYPSIANFTDPTHGANFYAQQQFMANVMINRLPQMSPKSIEAAGYSGVLSNNILAASGGNVSFFDTMACYFYTTDPMYAPLITKECTYYMLLPSMFTSSNMAPAATYMSIPLPFDPTDQDPGQAWYETFVDELIPYFEKTVPFVYFGMTHASEAHALRDVYFAANGITEASQLPDYMQVKFYLRGYAGENFDTIKYAQDAMPVFCGVLFGIVFLAVLLAYGSLTAAVRITATVGLVVAASYVMTQLTFSMDGLDRMRISAFQGPGKAMLWMVPYITILLCVSVVLNYELTLFAKVTELRHGFSTNAFFGGAKKEDDGGSTEANEKEEKGEEGSIGDNKATKKVLIGRDAVTHGHATTNREVYSMATMMMFMFIGFGSLSHVSAMNQIGAFVLLSAFFGGFYMRILLSSQLLYLLGDWNWTPAAFVRTLPSPNAHIEDVLCEVRDACAGAKTEDGPNPRVYPPHNCAAEAEIRKIDDHPSHCGGDEQPDTVAAEGAQPADDVKRQPCEEHNVNGDDGAIIVDEDKAYQQTAAAEESGVEMN